MTSLSVFAFFCDDIREEKSGALTLVGVMGDNVSMPPLPEEGAKTVGMIARLAIYIRINFDAASDLRLPITFKITMPDGQEVDAGSVSDETLAEAKEALKKGSPMAGLVTRIVFGGIVLKKLGRMTVEATIGDQKYLAGFLNFTSEATLANP